HPWKLTARALEQPDQSALFWGAGGNHRKIIALLGGAGDQIRVELIGSLQVQRVMLIVAVAVGCRTRGLDIGNDKLECFEARFDHRATCARVARARAGRASSTRASTSC